MSSTAPLEIERKFLIEMPDPAWLAAQRGVQIAQIMQTYLTSAPGEEVRVRRRTQDGETTYVKTVKRALSGMAREEIEAAITRETYEALLESADPARAAIVKTRYSFPYAGHTLEVDVYPFWADRAILEAELTSAQEDVRLPGAVRVLGEVTDDPAYKNAALAAAIKKE